MPKTSKVNQNPVVQKIQKMQLNQLHLEKKQQSEGDYQMFDNFNSVTRQLDIGAVNITDASIFSASISKHSSSKSKIILKPSQITKASYNTNAFGQNLLSSTQLFGSHSVNNPAIYSQDDGLGAKKSFGEEMQNLNSTCLSPGLIVQKESQYGDS